jgi:hypothetical protein
MYFNPPIEERSTEQLIEIAYLHPEDWQEEAVILAKNVLVQRNVSQEYIQQLIAECIAHEQHQQNIYHHKRQKNAKQSYSKFQLLCICVLSVFIVGKFISWGPTLSELKESNHLLKFKQRIGGLVIGTVIWVTLFSISLKRDANRAEKAFQQQMDTIDISDWENNHPH